MTNLFLGVVCTISGSFLYGRGSTTLAYMVAGIALINYFIHILDNLPVTERQIRRKAEQIWISEGRPEGKSHEHWRMAEEELRWN
jgi:hypothetical protein